MTDDLDWLTQLQVEINRFVPPTSPRGLGHRRTLRQVSEEEWTRIRSVVDAHALICSPHNACMGFNFGVSVCSGPVFPGAPTTFLVEVTGEHFDLRFSDAFDKLSVLTHNATNAARLKHAGLGDLRDRTFYDY